MNRPKHLHSIAIAGCVVALTLGAVLWANARSTPKSSSSGAASPEPVASVVTVLPIATNASREVLAYGDVAPAKTQSVTFSRAGQLAELTVVVGQRVPKGTLVARLVGDPAAEATLVQARSASTLADAEVKRAEQMMALQLATQSQVDTARKNAQDARSNLVAQQKLGVGEGALQALAPFDGVVLSLAASVGDRLAAGAPILQLGRVDKLRVNLGIDPAQRTAVHVGDSVKVAPLGAAGAGAPMQSAEGQVASIQDIVDPRTQLVSATVDMMPGRAADALVPGVRVAARIQTGSQPGWSIPRQSVLSDDKGSYVYSVAGDVARRLPVTTLSDGAESVVVDGSLSDRTPVVSVGNYELSDGMKIAGAKQ